MAFDFAAAKLQARRAIHESLGVSALYQDSSLSEPVPIKARWHNGRKVVGDLDNEGYAQIEGLVETVVLSKEESEAVPVKRGGTIKFPQYNNVELVLQQRKPDDGPYEVIWEVARK